MATALWVRTIKHHRMDLQNVQPCTRDDPQEALQDACHALDLPKPLWLPKNQREWRSSGRRGSFPTRSWSMWTLTAWKSNTLTPTPRSAAAAIPATAEAGAFCPPGTKWEVLPRFSAGPHFFASAFAQLRRLVRLYR